MYHLTFQTTHTLTIIAVTERGAVRKCFCESDFFYAKKGKLQKQEADWRLTLVLRHHTSSESSSWSVSHKDSRNFVLFLFSNGLVKSLGGLQLKQMLHVVLFGLCLQFEWLSQCLTEKSLNLFFYCSTRKKAGDSETYHSDWFLCYRHRLVTGTFFSAGCMIFSLFQKKNRIIFLWDIK